MPLKAMSITSFVYPQMDKKNVVAMDGHYNSLSFPRPTWKAQSSTFVLCFLSVSFFIFNARRKQTPSLYFFVCHKKKVNSITKFTKLTRFPKPEGLELSQKLFLRFFFLFFFSSLFLCLSQGENKHLHQNKACEISWTHHQHPHHYL